MEPSPVTLVDRISRRLRYGRPIVVVSGLPRSGTSMLMKMLQAGGVSILSDGIRKADESNPNGYFEFEPVKTLDRDNDPSWLPGAKGKAVKIISFLLTWLPETYDYNVIFLRRNLDEVIASQGKMLIQNGQREEADADRMDQIYRQHLQQVDRFVSARRCFRRMDVDYHEVLRNPAAQATRISAFLGGKLDIDRMTAGVDGRLHHVRRE
jgi:hypothetical protein